jgi:hypothetical protein
MGNLTFEEDLSLHNADSTKPNNYRDIMHMICESYKNITNLAIFGFGAKTSNQCKKSTAIFPLTRSIRNPFIPNYIDSIDEVYSSCLK